MPDVPDDLVGRRVELVEERNRQLDDTEGGTDVAAGDRTALDETITNLLNQLGQLVTRELLEIGRALNLGEK